MKICKSCKGKGWSFEKGTVFTGKYDVIFDIKLPRYTDGMVKVTCNKCFGKGRK
ncbi:hypothetical protein [Niallia sp. RD1]|uniref:hypothetical protein n=1 Tax=Niallia sp. RD1 TaxID=2962858 RepID=UPI0020C18B50|nr:hypothetical protein [Niallia sp. RD1]UTI41101.1 hypothetical protein NKG37_19900 [Niallia sp. RD1]